MANGHLKQVFVDGGLGVRVRVRAKGRVKVKDMGRRNYKGEG